MFQKFMYAMPIAISLLLPAAAYCQESSPKKDSSKSGSKKTDAKSAPKQASAPAPNTPPDGAEKVDKMPPDVVEVRTDIFRRVDENGKAWIYRRMPFGIFKSAESENMRQLLADPPDKQMVKELEDGTLEFSKLTPWGVGRYTRKKEEMTDEEKVIWEKYKKSRDAGSPKKEAKEQQK
jgi:hypothetical protein